MWLADGESTVLARSLGLDEQAFAERYVRRVPDPRSGAERLALRERPVGEGGGCVLLEGRNHCRVYAQRPEHCRAFPYWPSVLCSRAGFERARALCPGIRPEVDEGTRQRAFAELEALYAEVDAFVERSRSVCIRRGTCCRFEDAGHELFASGLEADHAAARCPDAPAPEAPGRCPYHVGGRCTAREGRPLGCRTYFCDRRTESVLAEAHEHFLGRLREIERRHGYPATYARFPALLAERGVGGAPAGGPG